MKVVEREERIRAVDGLAVFVVHDDPELIRDTMLADLDVPFPVLVDRERLAYERWGMQRASFARIWLDPSVWKRYAQLLMSGERLRQGGRDPRQLGGDFVVAPDGTLAYARPQRRDDRPPAGALVEQLEGASGR